jgi:uncharacterized protein YdeI (YjbR/CyaY-like superfamily)
VTRRPDASDGEVGHQQSPRLSYTSQKRHALAVESAKTSETRQRRIAKILEELSTQP